MLLSAQLTHPGHPSICPAAIIVRDRHILLGMRHYTPDKWKAISVWTTPGGRSDEGETIEAALRREVQEEVNITDLKILDFIGTSPGAKDGDVVPLFLCTTAQEATLMEPEKFSEWRWVALDEYMSGEPWSTMNPASHKILCEFFRKNNI